MSNANKWVCLLGVITLLIAGSASAQIYKSVDANGIVTFSDRKPNNGRYSVLRFKCSTCNWRRQVDWSTVRLNVDSFTDEILAACERYAVDEALVRAIIHAESSFRVGAVSDMGAQGLMQLMPLTQQRFGVSSPFDPRQNIDAGVRYLRELLDVFNHDHGLASAAFNAGPTAVRKYGGVPPYEETQEFVARVRMLRNRYAELL
jgi:soluble lytic murein transglycosylase-like protein